MNSKQQKSFLLFQHPDIMDSRNRAKMFYQQGHIKEVVDLLKETLEDHDFDSVVYHEYTILIDSCFRMAIQAKERSEQSRYLKIAYHFLKKVPDKYNSFLFDKALMDYYTAQFNDAYEKFAHLIERSFYLDDPIYLYVAKNFFRMKEIQKGKAVLYYLAGNEFPQWEIRNLVLGKENAIGLDSIEDYNIGFGTITLEEMKKHFPSLLPYPSRKEVLKHFQKFIAKKNVEMVGGEPEGVIRVGNTFFANESYGLCIMAFKYISADDWDYSIRRQMAYSYYKTGEYTTSVRLYEEINREKPDVVQVLLEMSEVHTGMGDFKRAQNKLNKASELAPDDKNVLFTTGFYHFQRAQDEEQKPHTNINLWAKYLKSAREYFDLYQSKTEHVPVDKLNIIESSKRDWQHYEEVKHYKKNY